MVEEVTLLDDTYVIFDLETTGLYPNSGDTIIEIGAVKLTKGKVIDRFDLFINPGKPLSDEIIKVTGINDDMLKNGITEKEGVEKFKNWIGDIPLVAHNAKFDIAFIENAYLKYDLGKLKNVVIDTLGLSRYLESNERYHNLATLVKRYEIPWDEDKHHRADYDSEGTALIFLKMLKKLSLNDFKTIKDLYKYPFIVIRK